MPPDIPGIDRPCPGGAVDGDVQLLSHHEPDLGEIRVVLVYVEIGQPLVKPLDLACWGHQMGRELLGHFFSPSLPVSFAQGISSLKIKNSSLKIVTDDGAITWLMPCTR